MCLASIDFDREFFDCRPERLKLIQSLLPNLQQFLKR